MIFKLFACCIPVKGPLRTIICDLQRRTFSFIPNKIYELLTEYKDKHIDFIKSEFNNEYDNQIDIYYAHLIEKEFGFFCENPEQFPEIDLTWKHPSIITNAIIDFNKFSNHDVKMLANELENLGCIAIQLRFFDYTTLGKIQTILNSFNLSRIHDIELILKDSRKLHLDNIEKLCFSNPRISRIIVHSSTKTEKKLANPIKTPILFTQVGIVDHTYCGYIDYSHFMVNIPHFTESQKYNNCLNKKIGIDVFGEIRNCPSMSKSYGNIKDYSISEVVIKKDFQEIWHVSKNLIDICKICEFRFVCPDCRAYTVENGKNSKPIRCSYDPYKAKW